MTDTATRQKPSADMEMNRRRATTPVVRGAGSLLDRLFTPHGASAYLRWVGLAPSRSATPDLAEESIAAPTGADAASVDIPDAVDEAGPRGRRRPTEPDVSAVGQQAVGTVRFETSGLSAVAEGTLLETAEAAGLAPRNRCRRGICGTCTTPKLGGTVVDVRTGEASDAAGPIRICVSVPQGDVSLDL